MRSHPTTLPHINVLGVGVSEINLELACQQITLWVRERTPNYICVTSVHGISECQDNEELAAVYNAAGMVTPDGMPLVWLSWLQGRRQLDRVYGPDLMLSICAASATTGYRHYFYGSSPKVLGRLETNLLHRFPRSRSWGPTPRRFDR